MRWSCQKVFNAGLLNLNLGKFNNSSGVNQKNLVSILSKQVSNGFKIIYIEYKQETSIDKHHFYHDNKNRFRLPQLFFKIIFAFLIYVIKSICS